MATDVKTPSPSTLQQDVKNAPREKSKIVTTPVSHDDQHSPVVLHNDTLAVVGKMFAAQSDFENESKYTRTFMHTAVLTAAKQECRRIINAWDNAITKANKLHPSMSREDAEKALLESKRNREVKAQVEICVSLLKDEFKS